MSRIIDTFLIYQFIRRLTTRFEDMELFKLGIIDKDGNFLKRRRDLQTSKERNAMGYFDVMVINLRKLLMRIPGGRTRLATYAAALYLIREHEEARDELPSLEQLQEELNEYIEKVELNEDSPTMAVGSGKIAGLGVGPDGEPGLTKAQQKRHRKRDANTGPIIADIKKRRKIEEAFDRPEPFKIEKRENNRFAASSRIGSDRIIFTALRFEENQDWDVAFYANGTADLTGSGNPIKVFSTVMAMMKKFLEEYEPTEVTFSGEKDSGRGRSSLYDRMTKRFASQYGYNVTKKDVGRSTQFTLKKK